jgi:hypothetical protein
MNEQYYKMITGGFIDSHPLKEKTQKHTELLETAYRTIDRNKFQDIINLVKTKEQLQDLLRAKFEQWHGNKPEWLEYTRKKITPPKSSNEIEAATLLNCWNDWFKEMEQKYSDPKPTEQPQKLSLRQIALKYIYEKKHIQSTKAAKDILIELKSEYKTGSKLYSYYRSLKNSTDRICTNDTSTKKKTDLIKDMEAVLPHLETQAAKDKCLDEINTLDASL